MFGNVKNVLSAQDKMLNYSISAIYTATAVLLELLNRDKIEYTQQQIDKMCTGFSNMKSSEVSLEGMSEAELDEILLGLLTDGIDLESRKKSGSERTPDEIIKYMLDLIDYNENTSMYRSIIDPACGTGTFIKQILDRFIAGLYKYKTTNEVKEKLLVQKLIRAYDTKPSNVFITKIVMISALVKNKLICKMDDVLEMVESLPVYCEDFLKVEEKTDYVIGNPPYIRLQNMPVDYRDFVKKNYTSATGRFDIFTCFMEKGDRLLNENGRMCLITSNKYLTANYGVGIRRYLSAAGHVRKVIDLSDTKFFGAAVLPAIILCENNRLEDHDVEYIGIKMSEQEPQYCCLDANELFEYIEEVMGYGKKYVLYGNEKVFEVSRSKVRIPMEGKTWNFSTSDENTIKTKMDKNKQCSLMDIFDVCVGIKTTADTVFVKPMTKKFVDEHRFERQVIYPLLQSFNVNKWNITWGENAKDRYILYPHREVDGNMVAIPLEEMPQARAYLEECAGVLKKRSYLVESKTRVWYECWVPQRLSKFQQIKIVTRDIVSNNSFALDESGRLCQGNTFFLTKKASILQAEYAELSEHQYYCFALGVLNSKAMEYYQKMISGCLYSQKYRYTTSNLNRWPMPRINKENALKISGYVEKLISGYVDGLEEEIDKIIYNAFDLTKEEIVKIESYIA
jgi:type I restriction-modification system DNA methylase subunit